MLPGYRNLLARERYRGSKNIYVYKVCIYVKRRERKKEEEEEDTGQNRVGELADGRYVILLSQLRSMLHYSAGVFFLSLLHALHYPYGNLKIPCVFVCYIVMCTLRALDCLRPRKIHFFFLSFFHFLFICSFFSTT